MTIPFDNIYDYIQDLDACKNILLYIWKPHGSKNINDLTPFRNVPNNLSWTSMIMHDQEPLMFDFFANSTVMEQWKQKGRKATALIRLNDFAGFNLMSAPDDLFRNSYKLLCHSELKSSELEKYQHHGAIGVYYFAHALISRSWYQYAEYDPSLHATHEARENFLIYCRAWSGSREYRLKFLELVLAKKINSRALIFFNSQDNGNYLDHKFANKNFVINQNLNVLGSIVCSSNSSATYDSNHYAMTRFDVVLETLFDDTRWHLTEKIFRPIACAKPFVLVSTPGSLQYLREYGFETFGDIIDESYDDIVDPLSRLQAVTDLLASLNSRDAKELDQIESQCKEIAQRNQQRFFSEDFYNLLLTELQHNLSSAVAECHRYNHGWLHP
jgi:hypothetical protein